MPAGCAMEYSLMAGILVGMMACGTFLRGVSGVHCLDGDPPCLAFVPQLCLEIGVRPVRKPRPCLLPASPFALSEVVHALQVFKHIDGNAAGIRICLADTMVDVLAEPPFTPRELLQPPLRRARAFRLQRLPVIGISSLCFLISSDL